MLSGTHAPKVSFEQVERELRGRNFGILSTVSRKGRAQSAGVHYGVSPPNAPSAIYVMTQSKTVKAQNITANPNVSFIVPLSRRVLSFVPPACIQCQGTARILEATDEVAIQAFKAFYLSRMMLNEASRVDTAALGEVCFVRIEPDPVINTYGLGFSVWQLREHMANAASKVHVPRERRRS
jgi:nitroimidazol reductase NimA-like FMN-containing flavoprotein (pyridoxamine 5'-phosphate oxidase superfamily)